MSEVILYRRRSCRAIRARRLLGVIHSVTLDTGSYEWTTLQGYLAYKKLLILWRLLPGVAFGKD